MVRLMVIDATQVFNSSTCGWCKLYRLKVAISELIVNSFRSIVIEIAIIFILYREVAALGLN